MCYLPARSGGWWYAADGITITASSDGDERPRWPRVCHEEGGGGGGGAAAAGGGSAVSLNKEGHSSSSCTARRHAASWKAHDGPGLDMDLLKRREEILWSADLPLYEDMLHDNGISCLRVRVRVMPSCFLVLLRHNLRIDGVYIQQKEVRLFHKFGEASVIRSHRTARKALPPLPSAMTMRASAEEQAARHERLKALTSKTMAPLRTAMPHPDTTMPPRTTMPPPTMATTTMPPRTTMPPTTTMPPRTTMPPTTSLPLPTSIRRPMMCPGDEMPTHSHRIQLDEQRIAEILQDVEAVEESTEEAILFTGVEDKDKEEEGSVTAVTGTETAAAAAPLVPTIVPIAPLSAALSVLTVCTTVSDGSPRLIAGDSEGTLLCLKLLSDSERSGRSRTVECTPDGPLAIELWRIERAHRGAILGGLMVKGGIGSYPVLRMGHVVYGIRTALIYRRRSAIVGGIWIVSRPIVCIYWMRHRVELAVRGSADRMRLYS